METRGVLLNVAILVIALCMAGVGWAAPMGTAFTYQGSLNDAGEPANGLYDFEFSLYDDPNVILGNQVGPTVPIADANVIDGSFAVKVDFGPDIFTGDARWLEMAVRPGQSSDPCDFVTLRPRLELTPTPYAIYAKTAHPGHSLDAADGSPTDSVYVDDNGNVGIGTTNPAYSLDVSGVARVQSTGHANFFIQAGGVGSAYLNLKPASDSKKWKIIAREDMDRLQFWPGQVYFTRDGKVGIGTTSPTAKLHIGGTAGVDGIKFPDGTLQTTAGGVGGDGDWTISGDDMYSAVPGNVGIGTPNPQGKLTVNGAILRDGSMMYGSNADTHINLGTTSTTGTNGQNYSYATVGGGVGNEASDSWATVGGGYDNTASEQYATVGGGYSNAASGYYATVGGGVGNEAVGYASTVGGGFINTASDSYATVGGGYDNEAAGDYSFAAGRQAKAYHQGSFVWGDSTSADFASTANDQFLIRASGGVGIGTTSPTAKLHIGGTAGVDGLRFPDGTLQTTAGGGGGDSDWIVSGDDMYSGVSGNVGIGTSSPSDKLHIQSSPPNRIFTETTGQSYSGIRSKNSNVDFFVGVEATHWEVYQNAPNPGHRLVIDYDGDVGIGTIFPAAKLHVAGRARVEVLEITGGSDLSEQFEVSGEVGKVEPGMVVCIDPENPGNLVVSSKAYDRTVAGIVSGAGGVKPGMLMGQKGTEADGEHPVALTGRVYCRADASNGPIEPGDLLTTSDMAGHAMKVTDYTKAQGAILGKAMSSLESGKGLVLVLVSLQ